jgi:hypothetical protein
MRLAAGDPRCGPNVEVFLDGVKQENLIEADEELGRIVQIIMVDGHVQLNAAKTDTQKRVRYGRVRIRIWDTKNE